jgi:hypothetical protein
VLNGVRPVGRWCDMAGPIIGLAVKEALKKAGTKFAEFGNREPVALGGMMLGPPIVAGYAGLKSDERKSKEYQKEKDKKNQKQYEEQDKQEGREMKKGGVVGSASKRADGCAQRGKTRGKMV